LLKYSGIGFEVLTAMAMKSSLLWDVTPCSPLKVNGRFEETHRLHHQDQRRNQNQTELCFKLVSYSTWLTAGNAVLAGFLLAFLFSFMGWNGMGSDCIHLVRQPLIGLLYQPRKTDEYGELGRKKLAAEVEVLG
jgi:hypothetical protein